MHLLFTPLAVQDFEHIGDFIARDNSTRAVSFVAEIEAQCQKICINPEGYQKRPELSTDLRSCALALTATTSSSLNQTLKLSPSFASCMVQETCSGY